MPGQCMEESRFLPSSGFLGNCVPRSLVVVPPPPLPLLPPRTSVRPSVRRSSRAHAFSFVRPSFPTLALGPTLIIGGPCVANREEAAATRLITIIVLANN